MVQAINTRQPEGTPICGIFGFIGKSKNQNATWHLANALMIKTEIRGEHATGFWAAEVGDGAIWFDKEAVKPTEYAKRAIWKDQFPKAESDLMIAHCRQCSAGVGNQNTNRNNHPHVTNDCRIALVHNGRIPEHTQLKSKFELHSECDSEVLLALFETGHQFAGQEDILKDRVPDLPADLAYRAIGMTEIFRHINYGWMAVAVGERVDDGSRLLWLHRDAERPIHVVDLRESLGQIFFFSTPEIWRGALTLCSQEVRNAFPAHQEVGIFPADELWLVRYAPTTENEWGVFKWKITRSKFTDYDDDDEDGKVINIKRLPGRDPAVRVISRLNEKEDIVSEAIVNQDATPTETVLPSIVDSGDSGDEDKKKGTTVDQPVITKPDQGGVQSAGVPGCNTMKQVELAETSDINQLMSIMEKARAVFDEFMIRVESKAKEEKYSSKCVSFLVENMKHVYSEIKGTSLLIQ